MSSNRVKKSVSVENESVTFGFEGNSVEFRLDQLSGEMITRLALHGLSQKLGDSYADSIIPSFMSKLLVPFVKKP